LGPSYSTEEGLTMDRKTKLEKIADDFIEGYLRNNPIMVYSLDTL
jgi:hypothetical protein